MLVSIIVPVYNKEKYIVKCLQSLINQTYSQIEIIVIDDGSTDSSKNICEKMIQNEERIKFFSISNHGVSYARNFGIKKANGEKILFVDADDFVDKEYVKTLIPYKEYFPITGYQNKDKSFIPKQATLGKEELINSYSNMYLYLNMPYCKLYDLNIIKKYSIAFLENISYGEDLEFNLQYFNHIEKAIFLPIAYYYNVEVPNSLSRKKIDNMWEFQQEIISTTFSLYGEEERMAVGYFFIVLKCIKTTLNFSSTKGDFFYNCKDIIGNEIIKNKLNLPKQVGKYDQLIYHLLRAKCYRTLYVVFKLKQRILRK